MVQALHNEPQFSEAFISYLLSRNSRVEEDLVDQLFNSSEKRLARVLLIMANFGKEGKPELFMNKFRKLGFINYNGRLEVHNSLLKVVLHDNPHLRRGADRR
jgi:CRP/FNR family cyclic AMP-dependent transcriptional regulator